MKGLLVCLAVQLTFVTVDRNSVQYADGWPTNVHVEPHNELAPEVLWCWHSQRTGHLLIDKVMVCAGMATPLAYSARAGAEFQ